MTSPPVKTAETARFQTAQGVLRAVELRSFPTLKKRIRASKSCFTAQKSWFSPRLFIAQV